MDRKEFYDILCDFFTDSDIQKLDEYAAESAKELHEGAEEEIARITGGKYEEHMEYIGRDFLIDEMHDGAITYDEIQTIIGRTLTAEERHNIEWRF